MPRMCRFCLSEESDKHNPFLSPCACAGTIKYVHRICLATWRAVAPEEHRLYCQLCHVQYVLPRRWVEESYPVPGLLWNSILSQHLLIIAIVHYIHLLLVMNFNNLHVFPTENNIAALLLNDPLGLKTYNLLLLSTTILYGSMYAQLIKNTRNRWLYVYYGAADILRFALSTIVCLLVCQYTIFPCGATYLYLLSQYYNVHVRILEQINLQGLM